MKTAMNASLLTLLLLVASGCPFAQKQMVTQDDITREDGTVIPAGTPVYEDKDGNPTVEVTAKPYLETDVEKLEGLVKAGTKATDGLPYGIGGIIGAIAGAGLMAARNSRTKKREEANAKLKKTKTA